MDSGMFLVYIIEVFIILYSVQAKKESSLTARDLLETIAPTYRQTKLPPGFPSLNSINTDKFEYKTRGDVIKVSAKLEKPVVMFPDYVTLSNVNMNFTFNKNSPKHKAWSVEIKGSWPIGSTILHVNVTSNGKMYAKVDTLELRDIAIEFMKNEAQKDVGIDLSAITLKDVEITADIAENMNGMNILFVGKLEHNSLGPIPVKINVNKYGDTKTKLFSIIEFQNTKPEKVLKKLLNQKTLNIPFFAHMLSDSDLFANEKEIFGLSFSFNEVYYHKENSVAGEILAAVLQSHIPVGVTLLFPLKLSAKKLNMLSDTVKIAFVINKPAFDLLIDQKDKISIKQILPVLSKEFDTTKTDVIPNFVTNLDNAYTTHVSFNAKSTMFSIFVRLKETIDLVKKLLRIKITHLVLQRNIGTDDKKEAWKVAAKGIYKIGKSTVNVQYSELSDEEGKPYGLTGFSKEVTLNDIMLQFDPIFFPSQETQEMIENTEIEGLKIHRVRLYSRVPRDSGTPHILITGFATLPEWERDLQIAVLLLYRNKTWECKWAASLKHSPLSNIIQAFTGFDSRNLKLLHNGHILTTIISSPLQSYTLLPPHIITTPLLRLPVKRGLSVVALIRFPDNCGDDKMCESAAKILDTSKIYTVKGVISMDGFILKAKITDPIMLSSTIKGTNSTLQFSIGNDSSLNIETSIEIRKSKLAFDGTINISKNGPIQLQMYGRRKHWIAPFNLEGISFEKIELISIYKKESDLDTLKLKGKVLLGTQDNGSEIKAPLQLDYNPISPILSSFYANFTDITLEDILTAFSIETKLPTVLNISDFPNGLMLSYSGKKEKQIKIELHGEIKLFGRLLNCDVNIVHQLGRIQIITENSPAPVIFAKGQIIIQQDAKTKLRGPIIVANIDKKKANVTVKGLIKILGIESEANIALEDDGVKFTVAGKLMEYKETVLSAYSLGSTDSFQIHGCLQDLTEQVQLLLIETITKSANQSIVNMYKAEENLINAQKHFDMSDRDEINIRGQRDRARVYYEEHLLAYGRYEIKANDTCVAPKCGLKCFGCPKLNKCCRLDIFGHCIACSSWKACCWKNINPLCIAKHDGCHVVRTVAERDLTEKEAQLIQHKIILDNLEQHVIKAEVNKGKHKAVLEAAIDAKQLVEQDTSAGLNAHDAIKTFGSQDGWVNINSVCYNTSIEQAATGCMNFQIDSQFFNHPTRNISIWSCLKEDLVTEITESIANYIFPNIIDTASDGITEVATNLDNAQMEKQNQHEGGLINENPGIIDESMPNELQVPQININNGAINPSENDAPNNQYGPIAGTTQPMPPNSTNENADANLLDEALEDAAEGVDEAVTDMRPSNNKPPPNSISVNEKPLLKLINASKVAENIRPNNNNQSPNSISTNGKVSLNNASNVTETLTDVNKKPINNNKQPPNSISTNGKPEVKLIPASTLSENFPIDEDDDDENEEGSSSGKEGSAAGKESVDNELKEIYDTETSKKLKADKNKKVQKDKDMLVNQMIEQEELDEEEEEKEKEGSKPSGHYIKGENKKQKNKKQQKEHKQQQQRHKSKGESKDFNKNNKTQLKISYPKPPSDNLNGNSLGYKQYAGYSRYPMNHFASWNQTNASHVGSNPARYQMPVNTYKQSVSLEDNKYTIGTNKLKNNASKSRSRRSIEDIIRSRIPTTTLTNDDVSTSSNRMLFSNPFWDVKSERNLIQTRSGIPTVSVQQKLVKNVIHKRWRIPDNSNGRCHVFHQLIAICKDMAETIVMLEKSLKESKNKFTDEDKSIYLELFETEEFLVAAAKRVNVSGHLMVEAGKTLGVVRQGVNIWSERCSNEFDWQNESGVQSWLQAMDVRIQELGGYGVYRFLENLFHAFEALFEALTYTNSNTAKDALTMLHRITKISQSFDKIFKEKLSVTNSRVHANNILQELGNLRKDTTFC